MPSYMLEHTLYFKIKLCAFNKIKCMNTYTLYIHYEKYREIKIIWE